LARILKEEEEGIPFAGKSMRENWGGPLVSIFSLRGSLTKKTECKEKKGKRKGSSCQLRGTFFLFGFQEFLEATKRGLGQKKKKSALGRPNAGEKRAPSKNALFMILRDGGGRKHAGGKRKKKSKEKSTKKGENGQVAWRKRARERGGGEKSTTGGQKVGKRTVSAKKRLGKKVSSGKGRFFNKATAKP